MPKLLICRALPEELPDEAVDELWELGKDSSLTLDFCITGVGKINASLSLMSEVRDSQYQIGVYSLRQEPIVGIVNIGTCGAPNRNLSGGVECRSFFDRDMTPIGGLDYAQPILGEGGYSCGTGDKFSDCSETAYDVVDMEAYALARVAENWGIPFYCYKFVSDFGNSLEWEQNVEKGTEYYVECIRRHLELL